MALGLVCHWIDDESGRNVLGFRELQLARWRAGKYSLEHVCALYASNCEALIAALDRIGSSGIRCYRVTSTLFPLSDVVPQDLWDSVKVRSLLRRAGDAARRWGIRCTFHPGQFVSLASLRDDVVDSSIAEIERHAWIFDAMGLERSVAAPINVHGGKSDQVDRLCAAIERLSPSARSRLTLENDETCYTVDQLIEVWNRTGVPVTFDSHHHALNGGGTSMADAVARVLQTWQDGIKPVQHISNTIPGLEVAKLPERRKHSDYISYVPQPQLDLLRADAIDVEVEAKAKNLALFKMAKDFDVRP